MTEPRITRRDLLATGAARLLSAAPVGLLARPASADDVPGVRYVPLTLLHTNDMHGRVHYPGEARGLVRIATHVRRIRAEMPHVLLLDAGDIIHGTPEMKAFRGLPILAGMNALAYDAATVGNHEFDFGQDVLRDAIAHSRFPLLSANVRDTKTGAVWGGLRPAVVLERGGIRVGVFGLTTPTTVGIQWPRTLAGIQFTDPIEAAAEQVRHLREKERADVIVCLSHLGYEPDRKLAAAVPGMDVILGGHSHTRLAEQVWINGTLLMQTGAHSVALGRADLVVRKASNAPGHVALINGQEGRWWGYNGVPAPLGRVYPHGPLIPLDTAPEDPLVRAAYRPAADRLRPHLDEVLTTAAEPLPTKDVTTRETAFGNLVADAVRAEGKTEVGIAAGSQIGPNGLSAGPVRARDLYELMGSYTRQHLVTVRASGARIAEMATAARAGGKFALHVSGLRETPNGLTVGESPLDPARLYTVTGAAHLIQDYLLGRETVTVLNDDVHAPTVRDATIRFLRGHAPLKNTTDPRLAAR
jgi:2',3'-cyclic-nucleotide 2'-phosphodiesterase (5'-nucleotidase family)